MKIKQALGIFKTYGKVKFKYHNRFEIIANNKTIQLYFSRNHKHITGIYVGESTYNYNHPLFAIAHAFCGWYNYKCNGKIIIIDRCCIVNNQNVLTTTLHLLIDNRPVRGTSPIFEGLLQGAIEDKSPAPLIDWIYENTKRETENYIYI